MVGCVPRAWCTVWCAVSVVHSEVCGLGHSAVWLVLCMVKCVRGVVYGAVRVVCMVRYVASVVHGVASGVRWGVW